VLVPGGRCWGAAVFLGWAAVRWSSGGGGIQNSEFRMQNSGEFDAEAQGRGEDGETRGQGDLGDKERRVLST